MTSGICVEIMIFVFIILQISVVLLIRK
jgi:hypothetical protein